MWSDACVGGIVSGPIVSGREDIGYEWFKWFLDRFKDDFYIEFQRHYIPDEDSANEVKIAWANKHGVPIIATTDAHYYKREDKEAHETLLCIQYQDWLDNPLSSRFSGSGYHLMDDYELMQRHPIEYLNNTQLVVDKVDDGIIQFGNITPPEFIVPDWFKLKEGKHNV
jgi:DNA polymerase-3 subunit alpha